MANNFPAIEEKWRKYWENNAVYRVSEDPNLPKYYVLDMFPYPSGSGLHVGHPLGYIASDIIARFKRLQGYNVLHPMGFDSFGLPAEQYAIQTGQHPAVTTEQNINRYKEQLQSIGFSYDWQREVRTSDPLYYKWTQWLFLQMFKSWYNKKRDRAEPITTLIEEFEKNGNHYVEAFTDDQSFFTADEWQEMSEKEQQKNLLNYRLAYLSYATVNWCPDLGTVLANDEVKDGVSERGGFPVIRKTMRQWFLRITSYAERLLRDLEGLDWTDSMKEMQRNWIGRSEGANIKFPIANANTTIDVFTTRPDTIFGSTFMVLAPEHDAVGELTTEDQQEEVHEYIQYAKQRSERERLAEAKQVTGAFTGSYATNPFTEEQIPVWISDYVLIGYGSGAIMAVPAHDQRDYTFAKEFSLTVRPVIESDQAPSDGAYEGKTGKMINSGFLNGLDVDEAIQRAIDKTEEFNLGERQVNYKLRDANFSRQRYWGEPFPIIYKNGMPYAVPESDLPVELPEIQTFKPTGSGESPLASAYDWVNMHDGSIRETDTMPGFAGSSWYFLRFMDPHNNNRFVSKDAEEYWRKVDLYIGGTEHAVGHLMYARFFQKFLYDLGYVSEKEPFQKLINQGMIQGRSNFVYRLKDENKFVSKGLKDQYETVPIHTDVNIVEDDVLDVEKFKELYPDYKDAEFILEDGKYICGWDIEKMSKSKYNVVNPDDLIQKYGADSFRMYEMFLGPIDQHKPWEPKGIEGVYRFLNKFWRLFHDVDGHFEVSDEEPDKEELTTLHKTLKKVEEDIERFAFNTVVSSFMECVNHLTKKGCNKRTILEPLVVAICPYAPHMAEELWHRLGYQPSVVNATFPAYDEEYIKEDTYAYPVSINGKTRTKIELPLDLTQDQVEEKVLDDDVVQKWTKGEQPKKVIYVPGKIINLVV